MTNLAKGLAASFAMLAVVAVLALVAGCRQASSSGAFEPYRQISPEEALALMESESDYIILDVRTAREFASGHIPNAINVPVETIGTTPPSELPDLNQLILVYCRSGNRSKKAAQKLAEMGYANIVEFGGINAWPGEVTQG